MIHYTQPYRPPDLDDSPHPAPMIQTPAQRFRSTRTWPIFVAMVGAFVAGLIGQGVVLTVYVAARMLFGGLSQQVVMTELGELASSPFGLILLSTPMQLAFLVASLGAARLSPLSIPKRLGLRAPRAPKLSQLILVLGALFPAVVGATMISGLIAAAKLSDVAAPDKFLGEDMFNQITPMWILPFTLFVAIVPAICEEFFFRGYALRRFVRRFGPRHAIVLSTVLFAVVHINPVQVAFVIPIGLWLGYVAYRTDSIWLSVAGHALVNSCWAVWKEFLVLEDLASKGLSPLTSAVVVFAGVSFAASIWALRRLPPPKSWEKPRSASLVLFADDPRTRPPTSPKDEPILATVAPPIEGSAEEATSSGHPSSLAQKSKP